MTRSPALSDLPQVLALHCTGGTPRQWEPLAARLAGRAALHSPWLPRFPNPARPTLAAQAATLLEWLDRAPAPVHLAGHSHGGALALHVAARRPAKVASLALYEPAAFHLLHTCGKPGERALWELADVALAVRRALMERRPERGAWRFVTYWGGARAWEELSPKSRSRIAADLGQGLAAFEALRGEDPAHGRLAALGCPVLLLAGARSRNPARLATERLHALLPRSTLVEVAGAGHMGPLTHPAAVAEAMARHLDGARARGTEPRMAS